MWNYEHSLDADVTAAAVWARYTDLTSWPAWNIGTEKVELDGPFQTGTTGKITVQGQVAAPFTLAEVTENEGFVVQSQVGPEVVLRSYFRLSKLSGDRTQLTHGIELTGAGSTEMGGQLGPVLSGNLTTGVQNLVNAAA